MTKQKFIISGLILAVLAVAGFTAIAQASDTLSATISAPASANVGQAVPFSVSVTGGSGFYSYVWNFDDGEQAGGQSASHTYATAGSKTVTVTVADTDDVQTSVSQVITINEVATSLTATITSPANNADLSTLVPATFDVHVTGGSGFYSYVWNFGDGEQAGGQSASHLYSATGTMAVTVVVADTSDPSNQDSDSISVTVHGPALPPLAPTLNLTANGSTGTVTTSSTATTTLVWTSANVTACTASGDWTGAKSTSGSENVGPFTNGSAKTFTLACTGNGSTVTKTITLATSDTPVTTTLTISNVHVTDVTKNSAIVRWDTNLPANSRVIYDTTSHPDISGQSGPNYGYSSSTGTDSALVTSHAVTVTGLSANTKYYFRVISEN